MRVVLDTNTVVSALLWRGTPNHLVEAARHWPSTFCTSTFLLAELEEVLTREHLAAAVAASGETAEALVGRYRAISTTVVVAPLGSPVSRDPDDDQVIACAIAAAAEVIVSGDLDLLSVGTYEGIRIITAAECLRRVSAPAG